MLNHNSTRKMLLTLGCVFSFTLVCELLCLHGNSPSWMLWCSLQMRKFREIVNELLECLTLGRCRWKPGDNPSSLKTVLHCVTVMSVIIDPWNPYLHGKQYCPVFVMTGPSSRSHSSFFHQTVVIGDFDGDYVGAVWSFDVNKETPFPMSLSSDQIMTVNADQCLNLKPPCVSKFMTWLMKN